VVDICRVLAAIAAVSAALLAAHVIECMGTTGLRRRRSLAEPPIPTHGVLYALLNSPSLHVAMLAVSDRARVAAARWAGDIVALPHGFHIVAVAIDVPEVLTTTADGNAAFDVVNRVGLTTRRRNDLCTCPPAKAIVATDLGPPVAITGLVTVSHGPRHADALRIGDAAILIGAAAILIDTVTADLGFRPAAAFTFTPGEELGAYLNSVSTDAVATIGRHPSVAGLSLAGGRTGAFLVYESIAVVVCAVAGSVVSA
jgi:hypothetical protein